MNKHFKRRIALPQDHGSWVFIISPLLIGIFAGGTFTYATFNLIVAAMAAFMMRQPMTIAVKIYSGRRPRPDLNSALFWILIYSIIIALTLLGLILEGYGYVLYLAVFGVPVFAWHLLLVSQRAERRQAGVEIIATGVLSLSAPAVYWIATQGYDPYGWWLWAFTWLQSAASLVYAYLRLEQRELDQNQAAVIKRAGHWQMGRRAFLYTSVNLLVSFLCGWFGMVPKLIFIPFFVQWLETIWGIEHPAAGWKPTRIGIRQLIVSIIWTILFIIFWR